MVTKIYGSRIDSYHSVYTNHMRSLCLDAITSYPYWLSHDPNATCENRDECRVSLLGSVQRSTRIRSLNMYFTVYIHVKYACARACASIIGLDFCLMHRILH